MSSFSKILVVCAFALGEDTIVRSDLPSVDSNRTATGSTGAVKTVAPSTRILVGAQVSDRDGEDQGGPPPVPWRAK
jgi:hypothetical protein